MRLVPAVSGWEIMFSRFLCFCELFFSSPFLHVVVARHMERRFQDELLRDVLRRPGEHQSLPQASTGLSSIVAVTAERTLAKWLYTASNTSKAAFGTGFAFSTSTGIPAGEA